MSHCAADSDRGDSVRLVLASASPRRRMLLGQIGLSFEVRPTAVVEAPVVNDSRGPTVAAQVAAVAAQKARAGAAALDPAERAGCLVIGADTIVLADGQVLGKPGSAAAARSMLRCLAGRTHEVLTGVVIVAADDGAATSGVERTLVTFDHLSDGLIERYVATGEPMDKAGAYAVQGLGSVFIHRVEGCYTNVVGLPLALLARLLRQHGFAVEAAW